jgi:serine/threonine-protein kinase
MASADDLRATIFKVLSGEGLRDQEAARLAQRIAAALAAAGSGPVSADGPSPEVTSAARSIVREIQQGVCREAAETTPGKDQMDSDGSTSGLVAERLLHSAERYLEVAEIGRGGMARVVEVFDQDLLRRVAMKVLTVEPESLNAVRRFVHEAQITGQLEHPAVVPAYELGMRVVQETTELFFTMKRISGQTLSELITDFHQQQQGAEQASAGLRRLLRILQKTCLAVEYAHYRGVIHRDIKPDNIVVGEYGEAYLVDWGVAKIVESPEEPPPAGVASELQVETQDGTYPGTPAFLAPEVLNGSPATELTDVYGLGVVLYLILTGCRPYEEENLAQLLLAISMAPPPRPSQRCAGGLVPAELEGICLRAIAHQPGERTASARRLHDELDEYLEGIKDREQRRSDAERFIAQGQLEAADYRSAWQEARRLESEVVELCESFRGYEPIAEKQRLWQVEDQARRQRRSVLEHFGDAERAFLKALERLSDAADARAGLADLYLHRLLAAEEQDLDDEVLYYQQQVATYDEDGRYRQLLAGNGLLDISSEPGGAEVHLFRYVERDRLLVPEPWQSAGQQGFELAPGETATAAGWYLEPQVESRSAFVGTTPVTALEIPMGSYLVLLRMSGYRDVRYPVLIGRSEPLDISVRLYREQQIGEGLVFVPGGRFLAGGDPRLLRWHPKQELQVPDLFLAKFPVTNAEYLEFINDLAREDPDQARRHVPRWQEDRYHWHRGEDGRWQLPRSGGDGTLPWLPDHPVVEVSWFDAVAYCEWRSRRDGRCYRLPRSLEWEKAARGADCRFFPWGNHFDATWCNSSLARRSGPAICAVGEFPTDESPYGVRDLAGNSSDWCADQWGPKGFRVLRGGGWVAASFFNRSAYWYADDPYLTNENAGFRLAADDPIAARERG